MIFLHPTRPECPDASLLTGALSNAGTYADPQTPDLLRHRVFSSPCFGIFPPIYHPRLVYLTTGTHVQPTTKTIWFRSMWSEYPGDNVRAGIVCQMQGHDVWTHKPLTCFIIMRSERRVLV
jgi:hypothetical protein